MYRFSGAMSTNTAIFASVLLASRLDNNIDVFALTSMAVEWFALLPILRRQFKVKSKQTNEQMNIQLILIGLLCMYTNSDYQDVIAISLPVFLLQCALSCIIISHGR
jgi:phosphatidylinositol glycan class C protein